MLIAFDFNHKNPAPEHVVAIGNFDGVHLGHQALLRRLQKEAQKRQIVSCVLVFEPQPREFFTPKEAPFRLSPLAEESCLIARCGIDRLQVINFNQSCAQMSPGEFIDTVLVAGLNTRWVLVGEDFRFGRGRQGDLETLRQAGLSAGFDVECMPNVMYNDRAGDRVGQTQISPPRISSSRVRTSLSVGDMAEVKSLLGRPWRIVGLVVHGDHLGRTLGYPTANLAVLPALPIPDESLFGDGGVEVQNVSSQHFPLQINGKGVVMEWGAFPLPEPYLSPAPLILQGIFAVRVYGAVQTGQAKPKPQWGVASLGTRPTVTHSGEFRIEIYLLDFDGDLYARVLQVDFLKKIREEATYPDLKTLQQQIAADIAVARQFFNELADD